MRQERAVLRVVARQRQGQVEAQAEVGEVRLLRVRALEGLAALQNLEDQLLVLAAALAGQNLQVLDGRRGDGLEAEGLVDLGDRRDRVLAQRDLLGRKSRKPEGGAVGMDMGASLSNRPVMTPVRERRRGVRGSTLSIRRIPHRCAVVEGAY